MGGESAYLHELAETVGPRPATTDAEARAADFVQGVFRSRGLDIERQEFECPRTLSWAFIIYYLLSGAAAVASQRFPIPALIVGVIAALLLWSEVETRWGLSAIMPKGPSQNIVGKHVPRTFRGERARKIVVVAHYDSPKASLAYSPGLVRNRTLLGALTRWATYVVPVLVLLQIALVRFKIAKPLWYITLVVGAYLLIPLVIELHRAIIAKSTAGANDNASGVAAMFSVMEQLLPEPEAGFETIAMPPIRHAEEDAWAADVVPEDSLLSYTPASVEPRYSPADFDDVDWDENAQPSRNQGSLDFNEAEHRDTRKQAQGKPSAEAEEAGEGEKKRGMRDWLGLGGDFDVRGEGRKIGSWDQFPEEDEDDEFGWKGGAAGEDFDDPEFASSEAARIRRRVTTGVDRELAEKEVWFVATGAEDVGAWGMRAFVDENREELRDAFIINVHDVGSGNICYITTEGMARHHHCDRRLMSAAKRVIRENELPYRGVALDASITDATAALIRGFRAMSVTGYDINGRVPNRSWHTDVPEAIQEDTVEKAADFVTRMIREL